MKAVVLLWIGIAIGTGGVLAEGDGLQDPEFVVRAIASRMPDYGLVFGTSAGVQMLTALRSEGSTSASHTS